MWSKAEVHVDAGTTIEVRDQGVLLSEPLSDHRFAVSFASMDDLDRFASAVAEVRPLVVMAQAARSAA